MARSLKDAFFTSTKGRALALQARKHKNLGLGKIKVDPEARREALRQSAIEKSIAAAKQRVMASNMRYLVRGTFKPWQARMAEAQINYLSRVGGQDYDTVMTLIKYAPASSREYGEALDALGVARPGQRQHA